MELQPGDDDWLVAAVERNVPAAPDPQMDRDDYSFEDSERFEDDSVCSWESESRNMLQNWRGWSQRSQGQSSSVVHADDPLSPVPGPSNRLSALSGRHSAASSTTTLTPPNNGKSRGPAPRTLMDIAARVCARTLSFDSLEDNYRAQAIRFESQPIHAIPDKVFLSIIRRCFPESDDDIRLYSCLANGNADEYTRGESLFQSNAVQESMQMGYHLSAVVNASIGCEETRGTAVRHIKTAHNVSARIDRCRIVSVTCSCALKSQWCQHVVAVCLHRIHRSRQVEFRVTIWDSVIELDQTKLRKFAQYLVNELPRQYLPVAQKLIDALRDPNSEINKCEGAPDPTDGGHEEVAIWSLDQNGLRDNIRKILVKFCQPSPQVHCDVHLLSSTQPPIASEWQSLLTPLRCKEPEGLWNLLSIVREMYRRCDENATTLLHVITEECLANSQILLWWYMTKLAQTGKWSMVGSTKGSALMSNQNNAQYNCAQLCDEIVRLWRSAALNPRLTSFERHQLSGFLQIYQRATCERIWAALGKSQMAESVPNHQNPSPILTMVNEAGVRLTPENARFTRTLFPGFFDALEACQVSWHDIYMEGVECGDRDFIGAMNRGLSVDVDLPDGPCCLTSPNMPFLRTQQGHKMPKVYDPPTTSSSFVLPFYSIDMSQMSGHRHGQQKKRKKRSGRGNSHRNARHASEPYLPEFFDAQSLRHAAREAARRARHQQDAEHDESTESGQESDFPPPGVVIVPEQVPVQDAVVVAQGSAAPQTSGPTFPSEDVDLLLASAHETIDGMELKFARCEALHTHGYILPASERARELMLAMRQHPPDLSAPPPLLQEIIRLNESVHTEERSKGDEKNWEPKRKHRQPATQSSLATSLTQSNSSYAKLLETSQKTVRHMERALFLAQTLLPDPTCHQQVFSFVLHVLELSKTPMASRYLQVKLCYLEYELVSVLRSVEIGPAELQLIRERAKRLAATSSKALVPPVALAHFILDSLSYSHNMFPNGLNSGPATGRQIGRQPYDDDLALSAALETLGAKQVFGENDFPMLSESTRKQRGDLAVTLLVRHKDSHDKLGLILDKLLDPSVHRMYRCHQSNAAYFLEQDPIYKKYCMKNTRPKYPYKTEESEPARAICAPVVQRMNSTQSAGSGSSEGQSVDDETEQITKKIGGISTHSSDYVIGSASSSTGASTGASSPTDQSTSSSQVADTSEFEEYAPSFDIRSFKKRSQLNALMGNSHRASEAAAHFYTELAKRVLGDAGGTQTTVMFNAAHPNQNQGPHRKLHLAAFLIGLYALGVNNQVNSSWPTRTYSAHVSWITGQTLEIGASALEIMKDTWPAHLTPIEVASLADKAAQNREPAVVQKSAELALSVLPSAYALPATECQRAVEQCKEQSPQMLENACLAIEQAALKDGLKDGVFPEVLYNVSRLWIDMHNEYDPQTDFVPNGVHGSQPLYNNPPQQVQYVSQYMGQPGFDTSMNSGFQPYGYPSQLIPGIGHYQGQGHMGHHRPQSLYMQPPMQYGHNLSSGHGHHPSHDDSSHRASSIHQSHSAPNLHPLQQGNVGRKEYQQQLSSRTPLRSGDSGPQSRFYRLIAAHRVGMRAIETMGKRNLDDMRSYSKYSKKHEQDIDTLMQLSLSLHTRYQLGPAFMLTFFEVAARYIVSPFLLLELAEKSTQIFPRGNYPHPNHPSLVPRPPSQNQIGPVKYINTYLGQIGHNCLTGGFHATTAELMERAVDMFYAATTLKMNHSKYMSNETEEICTLVERAYYGMLNIPLIGKLVFEDFVTHVKKQKLYKKDLISKLKSITKLRSYFLS